DGSSLGVRTLPDVSREKETEIVRHKLSKGPRYKTTDERTKRSNEDRTFNRRDTSTRV
ncbi:Hypothetical predicted protein, partial [Marmota monax]